MAGDYKIPVQNNQFLKTQELIITTFGLNQLKTEVFNTQVNTLDKDKPLYVSSLGTGVFSDLDLGQEGTLLNGGEASTKAVSWIDKDTGKRFLTQGMNIETVLFRVNQVKNIVKTPIIGRNTTVKQYVSDGDYMINIKGVLTGTNGVYPKQQRNQLHALLKAPVPIYVNSWYLNDLGIFYLVVEDYEFPQVPGFYSQQPFEINCSSDEPIELLLNK